MNPHKHAELIKQWAEGAEIEVHYKSVDAWFSKSNPSWSESLEYRIKPKPKWEKRQEVPLFYERYDCYIPQEIHDFDTIHQFVTEFETDWDNQTCEVFKDFNKNYKVILCDTYPSLGVVRMSKVCAEKLCKMLNNNEVEL